MISRSDGRAVIEFIETQMGQSLPKIGFLAGQAVCSVLLYLHKKATSVIINDYDIFHSDDLLKKPWGFIPHTKAPALHAVKSTFTNVLLASRIPEIAPVKRDPNSFYSAYEYPEIIKIPSFLKRRSLSFSPYSHRQSYRIKQVSRNGLINEIFYVSDADFGSPQKIIAGFDINCTEVGINLATGEIFYTYNFLKFFKGLQLEITNITRPHHTFIRYFNKIHQHGYYGSIEAAARMCATSVALNELSSESKLIDMEIGDASEIIKQQKVPSRFGSGYQSKFHESKSIGIGNFVTMRVNNFNVNYKEEFLEYLASKGAEETKKVALGKLHYRADPYEFILNGEHRESMEKSLGLIISGYPIYARMSLPKILSEHLSLSPKRHVQSGINLVKQLRFKKNHSNVKSEFLSDIVTGDSSIFRGNFTIEHVRYVSDLRKEHDLERYFAGKTLEQSYLIAKKIRWLEKRHPSQMHTLEVCEYFDLLDMEKDAIVERTMFELEKYEQMLASKSVEDDLFISRFDTFEASGMRFVSLFSPILTKEEGRIVNHCIGKYYHALLKDNQMLISVRKNILKRCSAHLEKRGEIWEVRQFRGFKNKRPDAPFFHALYDFVHRLNFGELDVRPALKPREPCIKSDDQE